MTDETLYSRLSAVARSLDTMRNNISFGNMTHEGLSSLPHTNDYDNALALRALRR